MVKRGANTISNKVIMRACPNSARSADGECLDSCAVSHSACQPDGEMMIKNIRENGRGMRHTVIQGALPKAGTRFCVGVYKRPGKALFKRKEVQLCGFVWGGVGRMSACLLHHDFTSSFARIIRKVSRKLVEGSSFWRNSTCLKKQQEVSGGCSRRGLSGMCLTRSQRHGKLQKTHGRVGYKKGGGNKRKIMIRERLKLVGGGSLKRDGEERAG